jgi:hypothetical protein
MFKLHLSQIIIKHVNLLLERISYLLVPIYILNPWEPKKSKIKTMIRSSILTYIK